MPQKILVTGATGKVGAQLVRLLVENGEIVRAASRNPLRAKTLFSPAVESIQFDFEKPETFAPALNGMDKVFLMARPGDNQSDKVAIPFIDEAKKQGICHLVSLTAFGVEKDDDFMLRKLEKYVEASGIPFTHLRPNWFMQNLNSGAMLQDILATGALHLPAADAKLSFIDVRDVAAAGAAVLKTTSHCGRAYTLTGGEAIDHFEAIRLISKAANKNLAYVPISDETARFVLTKAGVANDQIDRWSTFFRQVREGFCATVSEDVVQLVGRPPILFENYAMDYAESWKGPLGS